ncbi:DsbA family oxidoreductase [Hugenholtzia roseola]|uniref:DsbA family oxidoreductase n=1 Tax=Hugenholtzia roseola TaxID=1002 RepID=UPI00041E05E1|nr:DsbA family oxidoreductase [Hugenholtzia roseola]
MNSNKLKIEIWSDLVCPFCYIGKRELENALESLEKTQAVEIEWKSFELMPDLPDNYDKSSYQFFAEKYGTSLAQAKMAHLQVAQRAKSLGLDYQFDKTQLVKTQKAHQFLHFAKTKNKQTQAKERLFQAFFTEGKKLDAEHTLIALGKELGFEPTEIETIFKQKLYLKEIENDIEEARKIGVRGVPFFVFEGKYAVSGAQPKEAFVSVLQKTFEMLAKKSNDMAAAQTEGKTDTTGQAACRVGDDCL